MAKPILAVDCDDVLVNFNGTYIAWHNKHYGTAMRYADAYTFDMPKLWGCSKEEVDQRVDAFYRSAEHAAMQAIPGAAEALSALSHHFELLVVTSRPVRRQLETETVLALHFPDLFSDIHFTNQFAGDAKSVKSSKSAVCQAINAQWLIEDAPKHALDVAEIGVPVLLPDRPWNQDVMAPGVFRCHTWPEMTKHLLQHSV